MDIGPIFVYMPSQGPRMFQAVYKYITCLISTLNDSFLILRKQ